MPSINASTALSVDRKSISVAALEELLRTAKDESAQGLDRMVNAGVIQAAFAQNVPRLAKPGADLMRDMTPEKLAMYVAASCLVGDAAEGFDVVKKHALYGKSLDIQHLKEELGDTLFYLWDLLRLTGLTPEECMVANVAKLKRRYPNGYTDADALARADKTMVEVEAPELEPRDPGE